MSITDLPTLNAVLNSTSAILLTAGWILIKQRQISRHRACMIAAFVTSMAFLISYLIYHYNVGSVPFQGQGFVRLLYFAILITHVTLAIVIVPMALITLSRGLAKRFDKHRRIARVTLPLWLYVSVTGVVVYVMLYHLA
jgi:putative membrane protein